MQEKTAFEMPLIVTFERDELVIETAFTGLLSSNKA